MSKITKLVRIVVLFSLLPITFVPQQSAYAASITVTNSTSTIASFWCETRKQAYYTLMGV